MNSTSSYHCPVEYLRWSWGAYLGLSLDDGDNGDNNVDIHSFKSYNKALNKCKWLKHNKGSKGKDRDDDDTNNFIRLITPQMDLPPNIHDSEATEKEESSKDHAASLKPPMVVVLTSRADPLHDDGTDFVRKFKMGGGKNLVHLDVDGSHAMATMLSGKVKKRFIKAWHDVIWE